jgi:hypothetical protein
MELFIEDDAVKSVVEASIEEGPPGWNIDEQPVPKKLEYLKISSGFLF